MTDARIYISRRFGVDGGAAGRIADRLDSHFGVGASMRDAAADHLIADEVAQADLAVFVVGAGWLAKRQRLGDRRDVVRRELAEIRAERLPFVVVLVDVPPTVLEPTDTDPRVNAVLSALKEAVSTLVAPTKHLTDDVADEIAAIAVRASARRSSGTRA